MKLIDESTSPIKKDAIRKAWSAVGLHFDVDLGAIVELDEKVEGDFLIVDVLRGNTRIEDCDIVDRAFRRKDRGEQGNEDSFASGSVEKEFENEVLGRVECGHVFLSSNSWANS